MPPRLSALAPAALALFATLALADPPATPSTPSTQPAPYVMVMPAGMTQIAVGDHIILCPPADEAAVRKALANISPTTRPTTTASTITQRLAASRNTLLDEISSDLNVPKDTVASFLDDKLKTSLTYLAQMQPRVYVVVATQAQITAAMKAGWHAPLFHYNPLADHTFFDSRISVPDSPGTKMDDLVIWSEVTAGQSDADIGATLVKNIHDFESGLAEGIAQGSLIQLRASFALFLEDNVIKPLKLPSTQAWFGRGLTGAMSAKYLAAITGYPRSVLADSAASDTSANPIKGAPLDLMHEFDAADLKPTFAPYYLDAVGRKGTAVIQHLLDKSGDAVVPKLLAAIKAAPPADNDALVALIHGATGVDLTNNLLPPPMP